jgi:DDE superfamily endonuclease
MPVPIICLDEDLCHFAERFRELLSKPQYQYLVTVLLGLMLCEGSRTLSGLLRQVAEGASLAGLSRFLSQAPWEAKALAERPLEGLS